MLSVFSPSMLSRFPPLFMKALLQTSRILRRSVHVTPRRMNVDEKPCKCTPDVKPLLPEDAGPLETLIFTTLTRELAPQSLHITNDSWKHAHHAPMQGAANRTESHFKVEVVSSQFKGMAPIKRHRLVYSLLTEAGAIGDGSKTDGKIHALQIDAKVPN